MKKSEIYVYVAGPYTKGDPALNTRRAMLAGNRVLAMGAIPFIPHLTHFWHGEYPRDYEDWMRYDFAWLDKCDILLRLHGESPGADREVERAHALGLPIFIDDAHDMGWNELAGYLYDLRDGKLDATFEWNMEKMRGF